MTNLFNNINEIFDRLLFQLQIGDGSKAGLSKKKVITYLKRYGDYSLEDFITTINRQFRGKFHLTATDSRVILAGILPNDPLSRGSLKINKTDIVILCLVFINEQKSNNPIDEAELEMKISEFLSKTSIKKSIKHLQNLGYIDTIKDKKTKAILFKTTEIGKMAIPISTLQSIFETMGADPTYSEKLHSILPQNYIKLQQKITAYQTKTVEDVNGEQKGEDIPPSNNNPNFSEELNFDMNNQLKTNSKEEN